MTIATAWSTEPDPRLAFETAYLQLRAKPRRCLATGLPHGTLSCGRVVGGSACAAARSAGARHVELCWQ